MFPDLRQYRPGFHIPQCYTIFGPLDFVGCEVSWVHVISTNRRDLAPGLIIHVAVNANFASLFVPPDGEQ